MKVTKEYPCAVVSAPELKTHEPFRKWLTAGAGFAHNGPRIATWHRSASNNGDIDDNSDVFLWKEGREGSDTDMPADVWTLICQAVGTEFTGIVWIKFF